MVMSILKVKVPILFRCQSNFWLGLVVFAYITLLSAEAEPVCSTVDGISSMQKLSDAIGSWSDYSCITEMYNIKPNKTTVSHSRFFYKKGPQVRIEVVGGGFRNGSTIVRGKDGSVRIRGGPLMGGIEMDLDSESRMLILPCGINAISADFPEILADLKNDLKHGYTCKVTSLPVAEPSLSNPVNIMDIYDPSGIINVRLYISPEQQLPLRWDGFASGKLRASIYFKKLQINAGLPDTLFKL
jgi:hypothetical protein